MCKVVSGVLVVICNLLFIPVGLALIIFGALIKWNPSMLSNQILRAIPETSDPQAAQTLKAFVTDVVEALGTFGLVIFIFGITLFLLSFCAVCGVCCKSKLLLGFYAACLLLIFVALLIFTIVFGARTSWFKYRSEQAFRNLIVNRYKMNNEDDGTKGITKWMNEFQAVKYCCGSKNSSDFELNASFKQQKYKIPKSCCRDQTDQNCWVNPDGRNSWMHRGCNEILWENIGQQFNYVLYALIGLLVFTFLLAVLSIYLLNVYARTELQVA